MMCIAHCMDLRCERAAHTDFCLAGKHVTFFRTGPCFDDSGIGPSFKYLFQSAAEPVHLPAGFRI